MFDVISPQVLSALIGSIYDCALDPSLWDQTLVQIRDAFGSQTATLSLLDIRKGRPLIRKMVGVEPRWIEEQEKHMAEIGARLTEHALAHPSLDVPHVMSRHISPAYAETSPYIQQCLKPGGIVDILQYILVHTSARVGGLGVARNVQQGTFADRELELGSLLLPHLRRSVTISNVLDATRIERARMADALDVLRCGVVLTDARGAILHANRSAEAMLRAGRPIRRAGGVLGAETAASASELRAAIALAAGDEAGIGRTGLAVRLDDDGMLAAFAHVLPLTGSELRTALQPAAVAAVFIGAPDGGQDAADIMAAAFDLTPAETRVLASLLAGRTMAETASTLDVSPSTAKTHLDNIFSKSGVNRQADLMRFAAQFAPPTSASR